MVHDPFIGRLVDSRYEIVDRVARGGMATVYEARDRRLDRRVALKIMHAHLADSPDFVARFRREARAAARLSNPGVVAVYDQGSVDGVAYLVMEFVEGPTLRDLMAGPPMTVARCLDLTAQILRPLGAAHRAGLVHRDIKPENVLLPSDGSVAKVADFGLARAVTEATQTSTGNILGTVAYLAPEIITDGASSATADIFAVGVVLFELLVGVQPFVAESPIQVAFRAVHEDVPPVSRLVPGIAPGLDGLVSSMTRRDPQQRLSDADAAMDALRSLRQELTPQQLTYTRPYSPAVQEAHSATSPGSSGTVSLPLGTFSSTTRIADGAAALRAASADTSRLSVGDSSSAPAARPASGKGRRGGTGRKVARRTAIGLAVLALAAGGSATWYFKAGPGREVSVPDIVGLSQDEAEAALKARQLVWGSSTREYSDSVPEGSVISCSPAPGASVRVGQAISAVISRGVEQKEVPDVVSKTQDEASAAISAAGLSLGEVTTEYSEEVAAGAVISSDPAAGTWLAHDSAVALLLSSGPHPATVPDVVGMSLEDAKAALEAEHLTLSGSSEAFSDDVSAGQIISSDPAAGAEGFHYGDSVSVVVSKGPEMVTIPSITGLNESEARSKLEAAGLQVTVSKVLGGWFGTARTTDPAAGTSVRKGSSVTLYVV